MILVTQQNRQTAKLREGSINVFCHKSSGTWLPTALPCRLSAEYSLTYRTFLYPHSTKYTQFLSSQYFVFHEGTIMLTTPPISDRSASPITPPLKALDALPTLPLDTPPSANRHKTQRPRSRADLLIQRIVHCARTPESSTLHISPRDCTAAWSTLKSKKYSHLHGFLEDDLRYNNLVLAFNDFS